MSAYTCWQGLQERLLTIPGIGDVLLGEPRGALDKPAIYGLYLDFETVLKSSPPANNLRGKAHHFQLDLVVSWVDQVAAETQMLGLIDAVTDAIEDDPKLGARLNSGMAAIERGVTGFATLGGTKYRIARFTAMCLEKRANT